MSNKQSSQFVRICYDDRRKFPWVVVWGKGGKDCEWCSCRARAAALEEAIKLRGVCEAFNKWVADS